MGKPEIIYEDNDIIVSYKSAGIATQTRRIGQQDMESLIRNYRAAKNEPPYVGIVHRLDQPVEGVMVFAKNQKAAASLSRQIKEHTTEKYYYAASYGSGSTNNDDNPSENKKAAVLDTQTLIDYIAFDKRNNTSKITTAKDPQAKKAVLEYKIIPVTGSDNDISGNEKTDERTEESTNKSITEIADDKIAYGRAGYRNETELDKHNTKVIFDIKLLTGRHHQIRLQFANIGWPLIGDTKYGRSREKKQLALCSYKIVIDHPVTGKRMAFEIEPKNPVLSRKK